MLDQNTLYLQLCKICEFFNNAINWKVPMSSAGQVLETYKFWEKDDTTEGNTVT